MRRSANEILRNLDSRVARLEGRKAKQTKNAKVDIKQRGKTLSLYVLQAFGSYNPALVPGEAKDFCDRVNLVGQNLSDHFVSWHAVLQNVRLECTRAGLAYSVRLQVELIDENADWFKEMKQWFKYYGISA